MRRFPLVLLILAIGLSAQAAKLQRYKDWLRSPEAYFLTEDERAAWKNVRTDGEAAAFVAAFTEKRGGEVFTTAIAERVAIADKYFTLKNVRGTSTLCGKLVILFGRPLDIKAVPYDRSGYIEMPKQPTPGISDLSQTGPRGTTLVRGKGRGYLRYTLIFPADALPEFGGKAYVVDVDVDLTTGKDRLAKESDEELDALTDAAIKAAVARP
jgi:GWxTD domain-containing protein